MKLIVGLGNPGRAYAESRHNIGFQVVRYLSASFKRPLKRIYGTTSLCTKVRIGSEEVALAIPLTFMNLSGKAVKALLKKFQVSSGEVLVVVDDLDLEQGRLKIRSHGSSGGHRGLKSIIEALASEEFCRLRVGIGRDDSVGAAEYVLSPMSAKEKKEFQHVISRAAQCCRFWVEKGLSSTMNKFNAKE